MAFGRTHETPESRRKAVNSHVPLDLQAAMAILESRSVSVPVVKRPREGEEEEEEGEEEEEEGGDNALNSSMTSTVSLEDRAWVGKFVVSPKKSLGSRLRKRGEEDEKRRKKLWEERGGAEEIFE